mgnify:CR=1 FL=1
MAIKISRVSSTLGTQIFLNTNTAINSSTERVENSSKINRIFNDTVDFKVSKEPRSENLILSALIENQNAAESTTLGTVNPKEIAILTKNYILKTYSPIIKAISCLVLLIICFYKDIKNVFTC